ncbi:hypothetical protein T440DRAFT_371827, partial [Plenodomus tracheiphilus IPT5]
EESALVRFHCQMLTLGQPIHIKCFSLLAFVATRARPPSKDQAEDFPDPPPATSFAVGHSAANPESS